MRARAHGRVKREGVRRRLVVRQSGFGAHKVTAKVVFLASVGVLSQNNAITLFHCRVERLSHPFAVLLIHLQAVDNYLNMMRFVAVEAHSVRKVGDFAVYPCVKVALA